MISMGNICRWGSQIPEFVVIFTSQRPSETRISQGTGPFFQISQGPGRRNLDFGGSDSSRVLDVQGGCLSQWPLNGQTWTGRTEKVTFGWFHGGPDTKMKRLKWLSIQFWVFDDFHPFRSTHLGASDWARVFRGLGPSFQIELWTTGRTNLDFGGSDSSRVLNSIYLSLSLYIYIYIYIRSDI